MKTYSLSHLANHVLLHDLKALNSQDRATTAAMLAHIAEVDERRLYAPAAYSSMYLYCVHELRMSEDTAHRRIGVARTARQFPAIFPALADGRLNMTTVLLLAPHLTPELPQEKANELLAAAALKTKAEIQRLLAERFPQPDLPTLVQPIAVPVASDGTSKYELAPERVAPSNHTDMPMTMEPLVPHPKVTPLSPGRHAWQLTVDEETQELLDYAQALLGHAVPSGDVGAVLKRSLRSLVQEIEKKKFAKCARLGQRRGAATGRYVPAKVRSTVWQRDGGQCTFISEKGKRCEERKGMQLDHIEPIARGGESTASNLRLRCHTHNQYEAERTFGAGFMERKREEARARTKGKAEAKARAKAEAKARVEAEAAAKAKAAADRAHRDEVIPWLQSLGFKPAEAKWGAAMCEGMSDASLEDRVQCALSGLARHRFRTTTHAASPAG